MTPVIGNGRAATITYPLRAVSTPVHVGRDTYGIQWQGDTALAITPEGTHLPLYRGREAAK